MDPNPGRENWRPPPPDWQSPRPDRQPSPPWPQPVSAAEQGTSEPSQNHHRSRPHRARWLLLAALLSAGLAVLLGISAANRYSAARGPAAVVRGYFSALADGNAPAALAYADTAPRGGFLTSVVLRQQLQAASLSDISVTRTTRSGSSATVDLRYLLRFESGGTRSVTDSAALVQRGSSWRLASVASTVTLTVPTGAELLRFAGRPVPTTAVSLFPGALPLAAGSPALQVLGQPMVRLADVRKAATAQVSLIPQVREQVEGAVTKLLTDCLAATSNDPSCPVPDSGRPIPGSVHGQATQTLADTNPRIELDQGVIRVRSEVAVRASWKVWDFENQPVQQRGSTVLNIRARLALDQPAKASWDWSG